MLNPRTLNPQRTWVPTLVFREMWDSTSLHLLMPDAKIGPKRVRGTAVNIHISRKTARCGAPMNLFSRQSNGTVACLDRSCQQLQVGHRKLVANSAVLAGDFCCS